MTQENQSDAVNAFLKLGIRWQCDTHLGYFTHFTRPSEFMTFLGKTGVFKSECSSSDKLFSCFNIDLLPIGRGNHVCLVDNLLGTLIHDQFC